MDICALEVCQAGMVVSLVLMSSFFLVAQGWQFC